MSEETKLTPVKSSMFRAVGYDEVSKILTVQFPTGKTYTCPDVSKDEFDAFVAAPSMGKHFNAHLKDRIR